MSFRCELWRDEYGTEWDLVILDGGSCIVREGFSRLDRLDGDVREGVEVIARFSDEADACAFLLSEGFHPVR